MMKNPTKFTICSLALILGSLIPTLSQAFDQSSPANSLVVDTNGNVGVGTSLPADTLHIKKDGAVLTVEDTAASGSVRQVLKLVNTGAVGFRMQDNNFTGKWDFRSGSDGSFIVANTDHSGALFDIKKNGRVRMGNTGAFVLTSANDLTVAGSVTANGVLLTSSRSSKTDISTIKPTDVMEKLRKVEVAEWRYKNADKNDRHISPMAEDFYALFKLGPDNKHINPNDLASVALIATKELQKNSDKLLLENTSLKLQVEEQNKRLASLERLVEDLVSSGSVLRKDANKVAIK